MNHVAVVVDHFFVSLLVLDVTLNGRLLDFVDPRLLNFHLCPAEMNVEVFAHVISIFDPFLSDIFVQLMAVVQPMFAHAIWTVTVISLSLMADHHRHHS